MSDDPKHNDDATYRLLDRPLSSADLDERTSRVARSLGESEHASACVMVFSLAGEQFAIAADEVGCVRQPAAVHAIPHRVNDIARGLCNIDGEIILCMSLAAVLRMHAAPREDGTAARFVVIGADHARWAFGVDEVVGMYNYSRDQAQALPLTVGEDQRHFSTEVIHLDAIQATRLDVERVMHAFEAALK